MCTQCVHPMLDCSTLTKRIYRPNLPLIKPKLKKKVSYNYCRGNNCNCIWQDNLIHRYGKSNNIFPLKFNLFIITIIKVWLIHNYPILFLPDDMRHNVPELFLSILVSHPNIVPLHTGNEYENDNPKED